MLRTRAEATDYRETSLHADVMTFLAGLQAQGDPRLHLTGFGYSPQGRELPLLVLSTRGVRTPAQARAAGLPIVLMQDGIHPGEVEGKEATLALVRDLLAGPDGDLLEHMTLLVAPLFNPDGGDALDPANRRLDLARLQGQPGPVVGTRTQSHGINLNRDYLRQAAPEMRLMQAGVCQPWAPDLTIDNHATNGSVHRFHMTVDVPHTVASGRAEPIEFMRQRVVPDVMRAVRGHGFDSGWYGNFVEDERALDRDVAVEPTTPVGEGWMTYPHHPRFGSNYRGLTNRLDVLLECYSYLSFEERVATARAWQLELLRWVAAHGDDVCQVVAHSQRPPDQIAVRYRLEDVAAPVEILTRTPRTLTGAPSTVTIPHRARFVGTTVVARPRAYAVPAAVAAHLERHGLTTSAGDGRLDVAVARVEAVASADGRSILEAAQVGELTVAWRDDARALPPGYRLVPTDQPLGAIAAYLCEPESDDGAVENGLVLAPTAGDEFPIWRVR
ncbi:MAG: M14 family metallopeptidase [Kofleriaceae bacterium]